MADTPGVASLQNTVKNYLVERAEFNVENWKRYLQIVARGFKNLKLTSINTTQVMYGTPDSVNQIIVPDFVDWVKVGYRLGDKCFLLNINKNLIINRNTENGVIIDENGVIEVPDCACYFMDHTVNGYDVTSLHGSCDRLNELSFNVDYDLGIIQFSSMVPRREMIIEYKSSGISVDGNTYIPAFAVEPLIEWLYWRTAKADPLSSAGKIQMNKQDYYEAVAVMEDIQNLPTYAEVSAALYSNVR